jgi:hypothetical protein
MLEPSETDGIDCHLQQLGMGTLTCRAARQTGDKTTNEVDPTICFNCDAGKIYREVGCDAVTPKIRIWPHIGGGNYQVEALFCTIRKRNTTIKHCNRCALVTAETTREIVTTIRGLFQSNGFFSAYKDIEKARESFRDGNFENTVTRSISCVESALKVIHENLHQELPAKKQLTGLWKSARVFLKIDEADTTGTTTDLVNSLSGVVGHLGSLRNSFSDAHGRGNLSQIASGLLAELAINASATLSTMLVRQYSRIIEEENE